MAFSVGTDIVQISRMQRLLESIGSGFVKRTFTARELEVAGSRPQSLAGRWAAKEAVLKALGTGVTDLALTDIEVDQDDTGQPELRLHGETERRADAAGITAWALSISHDGDYAVAVAVASSA